MNALITLRLLLKDSKFLVIRVFFSYLNQRLLGSLTLLSLQQVCSTAVGGLPSAHPTQAWSTSQLPALGVLLWT